MNNRKLGLLIQKFTHRMDLYKDSLRHGGHLFFKQDLQNQENCLIVSQVCLGWCNVIHNQNWELFRRLQNPEPFSLAKIESKIVQPPSKSLQSLNIEMLS